MSIQTKCLLVGLLLTAATATAQPAPTETAVPSAAPTSPEPAAAPAAEPSPATTPAPTAELAPAPAAEPIPAPAVETPAAPTQDAPSSAATASSDEQALLSDLQQDDDAATTDDDEPSPVQLYGFADIGYRHMFVADDSPWLLFLNRHPSVFVGNLNTYLNARLSSRWRALFEVRFTYLPHGAPQTDLVDDTIDRNTTSTADYTDFTRSRPVGGIIIERAQVEYAPFEFLSFKAGQWLTPYGIWNVDHGSPTIIGVSRPFIIGAALIPERQVGLMADGSVPVGESFELSYMLGVSNGRIDQSVPYEDLDSNKAVTARAAMTYQGFGTLTLGSSFFAGRYTDAINKLAFEGTNPKSLESVTRQFDEVSYAFDLLFRYEGLHLQSEWIVNDRRYTDRGRPPGPNGGLRPDKRNWGGYGLLGYRLPWFPLMPYVKAEYSPEPQSQSIGVADQVVIYTGGLNYRALPNVVLKAEYVYAFFPDGDPESFAGNDIHGLDLQLAVSF